MAEHPADAIADRFGGGWRGSKYAEIALEALDEAGFRVVPGPERRDFPGAGNRPAEETHSSEEAL